MGAEHRGRRGEAMGAVWKIEIEDFPAFIVVDDKESYS
jgi:tartrate dehydratase beta subunit/fumarate hydratase class I family protein